MFDLENLAQLIPLGSVTFLIIYLVGTLVSDRAQARQEKRQTQLAHDEEIREMRTQHRIEITNAIADQRDQILFQRERITSLEVELRECRRGEG